MAIPTSDREEEQPQSPQSANAVYLSAFQQQHQQVEQFAHQNEINSLAYWAKKCGLEEKLRQAEAQERHRRTRIEATERREANITEDLQERKEATDRAEQREAMAWKILASMVSSFVWIWFTFQSIL